MRRLAAILIIVVLVALPVLAALPATDAFTGTTGNALTTYSASWTLNNGDFDIQTNQVHTNVASTNSLAHWNADAFADNQYAQLKLTAGVASVYIGPAVRVAASAHTGYFCRAANNGASSNILMYKVVAGSHTQLGTTYAFTWVDNKILYIEASGTSITCKLDGVSVVGPITDGDIASGSGGITGYDNGATYGDDWEAGNLSAAAPTRIKVVIR